MNGSPSTGSVGLAWRILSLAAGAFWCGGPGCMGGTGQTTRSDGGVKDGGADHAPAVGDGGDAPPNDGTSNYSDVTQALEAAPPADAAPGLDATSGGADAGSAPMTMEGLQVVGTHNSYHIAPLIPFDASHKYTQKPLDEQLDGGVRALELDLHLASDGTFDVYHITTIDSGSTCQKLDRCLGLVATWSNAHPRHAPIFIWLEIKDDVGGLPINDLGAIETVVLRAVPRERVITPAWLRGTHASPRERIMTAGWPTLDEARGKIMLDWVNRDARTQAFSQDSASLDSRAIWANAATGDFAQPWAVVTKDLEQPSDIAAAHAAHLLIGVNTCAINMTDDACTARLGQFQPTGVQMLDDDLPFQISGRNYWLHLPGGSPGCDPITAPSSCRGPLE